MVKVHHIKALNALTEKDKEYLISEILYLRADSNIRLDKRTKKELENLNEKNWLGSALIITITNIGGSEVIEPIAISDGFQKETILALCNEVDKCKKLKETYNN